MRRGARWAICLPSIAALAAAATPLAAQDSTAVKTAHITYLTGATAYLDAGRLDGLRESARVEVVRGRATVAVLKVTFLASHRAACDIVSSSAALVVGDTVRFVKAAPPREAAVAVSPAPASTPERRAGTGPGVRGRIGVEYFDVRQSDAAGGSASQPSISFRLDGHPAGAPSLNVIVDVRARRTHTILPDGSAVTDGRNRVYQAALSLNAPGAPTRITFGRQLSGDLATVGLFDGVLAEVNQPDWSSGVFTGSQPEPVQLALSSSVVELGGYAQRHSRPGAAAHWSVTIGATGSYEQAHANREFAYVQGSYVSRRLSTFMAQEIDYYRSWKLGPGMHAVSPTSTFATFQYRATETVTLDGGFDNRRNVRLYRDVVNPETTFDDMYRQGAWAGVSVQPSRRFRVGLDARSSGGGAGGQANSYTLSLGVDRLSRLGLTLRTRTTRYTNPQLSGWLQSGSLAFEPGVWLRLQLNGGVRAERNPLADPAATTVTWVGADADVTLARAWYVMLSATRQRGGVDGNDQIFGGLSFRF